MWLIGRVVFVFFKITHDFVVVANLVHNLTMTTL